jgi:DNA gyrase/topoisomerase IV subunit A
MSALDMIEEIIDEIRRSKDKADARTKLIKRDFTEIQANAILEMRLSQLTKLDDKTLRAESKEVQARIKELVKLNSSNKLRTKYIIDEVNQLAERHGNARRSKIISEPKESSISVVKQGRTTVKVEGKPRFIQVDEKTGVLTQLRKMQRGCWLAQNEEKLAFMCDDGKFYKVSSRHKGGLSTGPVKVLYKTKTQSVTDTPVIVVWKVDGCVYANLIPQETLFKTTSKGKTYLPEGAELIHLGGTFTVPMQGRKKDKVLSADTLKARPVGGKGTKVANLSDTTLTTELVK